MNQWLQEFKRMREAERSLRSSMRSRSTEVPYWYDLEAHLPFGKMCAGYVRAALMRAVGEQPSCGLVEMPILLRTRDEITHFFAENHDQFRYAGFNPLVFELQRRDDLHILRVSVFSHEDAAWIEPTYRNAS